MNGFTLTITLDEVNLILKSLSHQPYVEVANTIHKIHQQANAQLQEPIPQEAEPKNN